MGDILQVTDSNFDERVLASSVPVLVEFSAAWCPPCKAMAPVVRNFADEIGEGAQVASFDVGTNTRVPALYQIMVVPTVIVFQGGREVARESGLLPETRLRELIESVAGQAEN